MIEKAKLKAEELLHKKDNKHGDTTHSTNAGPHSSNLSNKADPRVDSDRDNYGNTSTGLGHNTHNTGVGHNTGLGQNTGYNTTSGPHDSNLANKADPRVDSDRDGRSGLPGSGHQGHQGGIAPVHHSTTTSGGYGSNTGYGNEPVHNSNLANKLDPRVDSTTAGQSGYGQSGVGQSGYGESGIGHSSGHTGAGYGNTGYSGSTNAGPHDSNITNKLDPRVDSDRDNRSDPTSRVGGYGNQDNYGSTGTGLGHSSGNTGIGHSGAGYGATDTGIGHSSGHTGVGQTGYGQTGHTGQSGLGQSGYGNDQYGSSNTPGSGNADKTAGPHNSNLLNKLDPRVDADLDGSKTYGGNKTNY